MSATGAGDSYPLSPLQEGMLFHTLRAPRSGVYVQQLVGALREELDGFAFRRAWRWVVGRHPVLRTGVVGFAGHSGELLQRVHKTDAALDVEEHDWRGMDPEEREERLHRYLHADRRRGFELGATTPPMRLALFRMDRADYRLVWTSHHALLDGRSRLRVLSELFSAYEAFCRGEEPRGEPARPYRDYVEWLGTHDTAEAERFWRRELCGFGTPTPLVVDNAAPSLSASPDEEGFATRAVRLSERSTAALERLARKHGLTLNTLVQGAWALLLSRYSGEEDVVFGATRACQRPESHPGEVWVGLFINTLPVRVRVSSEEPLIPWLQRLRAQWRAAREHEHTPLVDVQAWSEVAAGTALFESVVIFEHRGLESALREQGEGWAGREFRLIQATHYPLTVSAFGGPELLLDIGFDRGRFEWATIDRMLEHLRTLLEGMAARPEARLSELEILSEGERRRVLVEWNDTRKDYPRDACIHELFEAQVERTPDAVALVFENQQLTYRELNKRANQLAHHLRKLGVGPEVLVGICVERSLEMVLGLLGILKAGGAYVPLDPDYPKERLSFMIEDARAPVLLTQERLVNAPPEHGARVVCLDAGWETIAKESEDNLVSGASPENLAYVIYTSGSTGKPKGVAIEHRSAVALLHWARDVFAAEQLSGVLASTSICFDLSVFELFAPLSWGGTAILTDSVVRLPALPAADKVTLINTVPSAMAELVRTGGVPDSVRTANLAGEPLRTPLVEQIYRQGKVERVFDLYGPSEDTTYSTFALRSGTGPATIGRPIANTRVYLLDRHLQPVPVGVPGELHVGGAGLARGYLGRPELTAEKFVPDPFGGEPGARLYRTGDLARYLPDGDIEFLGRLDHQVKIRGFRVELGEIEAVLGRCPAVHEAVVLGREDEPGDKRLVAYVVVDRDSPPTTTELRGFLRAKLPGYMVPSAFVVLDALPLTPNGKVDRRALPAPHPSGFRTEDAYAAPRNPIEETLAGIWAEVLGIERVGIHDDFFELGGHSLLAARLASRLSAALAVDEPLKLLVTHPTIETLADAIEQLRRTGEEASTTRAVPPTAIPASPLARPDSDSVSRTLRIERRPLLSLFAAGRLAPVDAAALTYLPDDLPARAGLPREEIRALWYDELPTVMNVLETFLGRIALIALPRFARELYEDQDDLVGVIAEALATAGRLGARAVSLTGLIPSATDYGLAIAAGMGRQTGLPMITTGHAATATTVVLTIERLLEAAGRSLADAHLGVLGWGSIGRASLRMLLRALPHPAAVTVCDVYGIGDHAADVRREIADEVGYRGPVRVVESRGEVPVEFYESTVVLGATNVADVLDVSRVRPGTVIVDYSGPHCFSVPAAVRRLREAGDILFTEGGVLRSPRPIERVRYLPRAAERTAPASYLGSIARHDPHRITGCVLAGLLCARFPDLEPTVGLASDDVSLRHYERLRRLGFAAAEPHCKEHVLAPEAIRSFRQRFGATPFLLSAPMEAHDRG